jgi:DHA3 family macrolide efflux protein-like MFS transporter
MTQNNIEVNGKTGSPSMRPFFTIWTGQAFSLLGSQLVQFAIVWYLARTTDSATLLAMATLAALLPQILIGPFAGALVDRWNRRWVMLGADAGIALATLALALLFWLNLAPLWVVYLLLILRSVGSAFHWPAMTASTTLMVPPQHLARVAGLNQTLVGVAAIFIPALGALALEAFAMQGVLLIDVLSAIPAVITLLIIPVPQPQQGPAVTGAKPSMGRDLLEGWGFVWGWKALLMLMGISIMINLLGRAAASLAPLLVLRRFQGGALELGWWQSAIGAGALLGGVLLGAWGGFKRKVVTQNLALLLDGVLIVAIALTPPSTYPLAVALVFLVAFLETIAIGLGGAIGQALVPPEMQGRVFALVMSLSQALAPLGLLVAGPVADALGVEFWWALTGAIFVVMGALALIIPDVANIEVQGRLPSLHP